ncbi:MAG: 50S ribosomal protein L25 [Bacteroidales bacterium]|nr:50S ribosomal protein L25 [Bacteroidales bacterium]
MRIVSLSGALREHVGKKDTKALRNDAKVPCVLYGKGDQKHIAIPLKQFDRIIFNPEPCFVEIDLGGEKHKAMLKDIDFHPVTEIVYHADFYELNADKPIVMSIPVHTKGTSVGVMAGGRLVVKTKRLLVKALPDDMPSEISIDITNMMIGQKIKVQDIAHDKFVFTNGATNEVLAITATRAVAENAAAASAEGTSATDGAASAEEKK